MRFAIGRGGEYVDSYTLNRSQIEQLAPFVCPTCHETVIIKQGEKRRLHFAHVHTCVSMESVGHHQDKWAVRQWLQHRDYKVDQEIMIGSRRADLLATKEGESIAFEVQASPLAVSLYEQRTMDYTRAGIEVVWVASGLDISPMTKFRPWMRKEIGRNHMLLTVKDKSIYRYVGFPSSIKYGQGFWVCMTELSASPFEAYYRFDHHNWTEVVRRKRMVPPFPSPQYRRLVLNRLYSLGLLPSLLPTACYMPLTMLWHVCIHPFEFQTVLYLNRLERPNDSVEWSIEKTCHQFGMVSTSDFSPKFHVQWRQLLNVCHLSTDVRGWPVPITLEEARRQDIRLFQGLQRFIVKSYRS